MKCPTCPEEWELVYDEYTDLYYCGACGIAYKKEEEEMSREGDTEKEMRLVRGFLPNFDKFVESTTFAYRGLVCVLMQFTDRDKENWAAGFFPRRFENEVMEPLRQLGLFSEEDIEPITGCLERKTLSPDEALKRMKDILKETIDKILDGVYVYEVQERVDKARAIVDKWMWEER